MELKISVVITVKNDEDGVKRLLADLEKQTVKPDEIIVVMAGKGAYRNLKEFKGSVRVVLAEADCSRGRGRNIGIRRARNELVAVTDVGCRPDEKWLEKIVGQMARMATKVEKVEKQAIVIAGWYRAVAETEWQKAFLHYLVPKARPVNFLPASRSIAFTKSAWKLVGGYPEDPVSGGEDLKFADNLYKNPEINIIFAPGALVDWPVPLTLVAFAKDIVKHTRGNFEAGYWPHIYRNLSVVARWMVMAVWPWAIPGYLILTVARLYRISVRQEEICPVKRDPALQEAARVIKGATVRVVADGAVVYGTVIGIIDEWVIKKLRLRVSGG